MFLPFEQQRGAFGNRILYYLAIPHTVYEREASVKEIRCVFPDSASLAHGAAEMFVGLARDVIAAQGRFSAALSGGTTPSLLFGLLGSEYGDKLRWEYVNLFWTDERAVPPDQEQSNFRIANAELISKIAIPVENVHRMQGEIAPTEAAEIYERELRQYFGEAGIPEFDLILLGVGEDGHTASLFPGSKALSEKQRFVLPVFSDASPNWRITLTMPVLNNASHLVFLVSGKSKAGIIGNILGKGNSAGYPAGVIKPIRGTVTWLLDKEAAVRLETARYDTG